MIVADTTAIIAFARIKRLQVLRGVVNELIIPPAVLTEITRYKRAGTKTVQAASWIRVRELHDRQFLKRIPEALAEGESEAIGLAKELGATFLSDDGPARKVAQQFGIPVTGTLAILQSAKAQKLIRKVKPLIDAMIANDFRLSKPLYVEFLKRVQEFS